MGHKAATHADLHAGEVVAGKYRVERIIGAGGMGLVYLVTHVELKEQMALKVLLPEVQQKERTVRRFLREAQSAARLKGPNIARVIDLGRLDSGAPFIVMEYLIGEDLACILARRGALPPELAVGYVLQACRALAEAHSSGIVHRDIKPANLFLTTLADGTALIKVLDFGVAKNIGDYDGSDASGDISILTAHTAAVGSPQYMSPEQILRAGQVDHRTDIWSLGVTLYELVGNALPFVAERKADLFKAILRTAPVPLRTVTKDVPLDLEEAVFRCLQKDPANRWATVMDFVAALRLHSPTGDDPWQGAHAWREEPGSAAMFPSSRANPLGVTGRSGSKTSSRRKHSTRLSQNMWSMLAVALGLLTGGLLFFFFLLHPDGSSATTATSASAPTRFEQASPSQPARQATGVSAAKPTTVASLPALSPSAGKGTASSERTSSPPPARPAASPR